MARKPFERDEESYKDGASSTSHDKGKDGFYSLHVGTDHESKILILEDRPDICCSSAQYLLWIDVGSSFGELCDQAVLQDGISGSGEIATANSLTDLIEDLVTSDGKGSTTTHRRARLSSRRHVRVLKSLVQR